MKPRLEALRRHEAGLRRLGLGGWEPTCTAGILPVDYLPGASAATASAAAAQLDEPARRPAGQVAIPTSEENPR